MRIRVDDGLVVMVAEGELRKSWKVKKKNDFKIKVKKITVSCSHERKMNSMRNDRKFDFFLSSFPSSFAVVDDGINFPRKRIIKDNQVTYSAVLNINRKF